MLQLHIEQSFEIDNSKRLGTMRIDWFDNRLANQWNPTEFLIKLNDSNSIDLKLLQEELNYIQFEILDSFQEVSRLCEGIGYDSETYLYARTEVFDYILKLIPTKDAYSYIFVFRK